jgi:hypothetical protein
MSSDLHSGRCSLLDGVSLAKISGGKVPTKKRGQSILEYSILIMVVAAAITAMALYVRRAIYANILMIQQQTNFESSQ